MQEEKKGSPEAETRPSRARRYLKSAKGTAALLLAAAVPCIAIIVSALHISFPASVPREEDWKRAAGALRREFKPGDAVMVLPKWSEAGLPHFRGLPLVQAHALAHLTFAQRFKRLWAVVTFSADTGGLEKKFKRLKTIPAKRVELRLYQMPSQHRALFSLLEHLAGAEVALNFPNRSLKCQRRGLRHQCGAHSWRYIGPNNLMIGGHNRRCIWAHPTTNARLMVTHPRVPLGNTLLIHTGINDEAVQPGHGPVHMKVRIAGRELGTYTTPNQRGLRTFRINTKAWQGRKVAVTFEITTPHDGRRHYCFNAEVLP